jgi:hypothetical protein
MVLNFIFIMESATYEKLGVSGGLTRFPQLAFQGQNEGGDSRATVPRRDLTRAAL